MKLAIVLTRDHRLLSVAAILDVFETVNRFYQESGQPPFFSIDLVHASQWEPAPYPGYILQQADTKIYDLILLPAFRSEGLTELQQNFELIPWLQQQYQQGAALASFCTGAFLLAATGLLNDRPATTHIDAGYTFSTAFPKVHLQSDAVVTEKDRLYTSGGATNSFHLMIRLIEIYCSREMGVRTAKIFSIDIDRAQQNYFGTFAPSENHGDDLVKMAQQKISSDFSSANTIEEIITDVPASRRNLARRFKLATGITPIEYLQKTRIEAAKKILEQTHCSILDVMQESGYNDIKTFRLLFKKNVGMTPTAYREKFNIQRN